MYKPSPMVPSSQGRPDPGRFGTRMHASPEDLMFAEPSLPCRLVCQAMHRPVMPGCARAGLRH
jgi:hypothetical protein